MRAIVTGGAGFIGSHLVDALLARGDDVLVLDDLSTGRRERIDPRAQLLLGDVRLKADVDRAFAALSPDLCFHLAAQADVRVSVESPGFDCEVNVLGTVRVLEAASRASVRVVLASTGGAIYGECERPAVESAPREPLSPYGAAKLAAEEYVAVFSRLYGAGHVVLRYGNVYGPRQDPHGEAGVVAIFLGRLARGEAVRVFGDGTQVRDYVYVADVVRATLLAAERSGGTYNVGTGVPSSVLTLAEACGRVANVELEPLFAPPRLGELQRSVLDPERARSELGFGTEVELEEGLARTWAAIHAEGKASPETN